MAQMYTAEEPVMVGFSYPGNFVGGAIFRFPTSLTRSRDNSRTRCRHHGRRRIEARSSRPRTRSETRPRSPSVFSIETEVRRGAGFVVTPNLVVTCAHVVFPRDGYVMVAGTEASVVSACPADLALLEVPALSKASPHDRLGEVGGPVCRTGDSVTITTAGGSEIQGQIAGMPTILYGSSGAILPSLVVDISVENASTYDALESDGLSGWSGSPVIASRSREIVGVVAHCDYVDVSEDGMPRLLIHAVPRDVLAWFVEAYVRNGRVWNDIGTIPRLVIQPLRSECSRRALPEGLLKALVDHDGGVRVVRVPEGSLLQKDDIILSVGDSSVDLDGNVPFSGFRTGFPAAFIGKDAAESTKVLFARMHPSGVRVESRDITLGRAQDAVLGVDIWDDGIRVTAGNSEVRLAHISLEWLSSKYGGEWSTACGADVLSVVEGATGMGGDGTPHGHIVIDLPPNAEGPKNAGWTEFDGMRILSIAGREVRSLEDAVAIAEATQEDEHNTGSRPFSVVAELHNGFTVALPLPLTFAQIQEGTDSIPIPVKPTR